MRVATVPAQVTTVEDRVTDKLSVSQIILLAIPVFGGSLLYAVLPPGMGFSIYKLVIIGIIAIVSMVLAIRIKGKIVLVWLVTLLRYYSRPRIYVFNKNSKAYRRDYPKIISDNSRVNAKEVPRQKTPLILGVDEKAYIYATFDDPASRLCFETTKKGGMNVRLKEVQE